MKLLPQMQSCLRSPLLREGLGGFLNLCVWGGTPGDGWDVAVHSVSDTLAHISSGCAPHVRVSSRASRMHNALLDAAQLESLRKLQLQPVASVLSFALLESHSAPSAARNLLPICSGLVKGLCTGGSCFEWGPHLCIRGHMVHMPFGI